MSKATTSSQLELLALKSANYTDKKVSELGERVAEVFEELPDPIRYDEAQALTEAQKAQARENIGAAAKGDLSLGVYSDGLVYIFANGSPVGDGVELAAEGDVIGYVDENNNIVITGDLASGTYVFKYEGTDGTYTDIGSLVVGGVVEYSITATLTNCAAASGNAVIITAGGTATLNFTADDGFALTETVEVVGATYTWDASAGTLVLSEPTGDVTITVVATKSGYTNIIDTVGYENDMRLSSSGATKGETGFVSTGMINISAYSAPVTIRTKGVNFNYNGYCYFVLYKEDGSLIAYNTLPSMASNGAVWNCYMATADADGNVVLTKTDDYGADYFRISGYGSGENLIVTINEEIAE